MKSQRQVEREYSKMKTEPAKDNRINCYRCLHPKCEHITKTIDLHEGTTPMMYACEKCGYTAQSTWYKDIAPDQIPTIEWYRPTLQQAIKMRKKPDLLEHVLRGGLEPRQILSTPTVKP